VSCVHANSFQALHKLSDVTDITIRDPELSPKGFAQCLNFAKTFEDQKRYITHILSLPMTRALNTACIAFRPIIESGLTVIALPQLQSLDKGLNGIGLDYDQLNKRYDGTHWDQLMMGKPDGWVDVTSFVPVGWNVKEKGKWSNEEFKWRMEDFKGFLKGIWVGAGAGRKRVEVAVVTHGSFLRQLVNDGEFSARREMLENG
jgi:broad specificity phosphatase PhoE